MTTVETLLDWLSKNHYYIGNDLIKKVEELKVMEKQQIVEARVTAPLLPIIDKSIYLNEAEQYYNETFNKEV